MNIKLVLFDMYGTILHITKRSKINPYFSAAKSARLSREETIRFFEMVMTKCYSISELMAEFSIEAFDSTPIQTAIDCEVNSVVPYPETTRVLDYVSNRFLTGIISNTSPPYVQPLFSNQIDSYFKRILASCYFGKMKPHKSVYTAIPQEFGIPLDQVLVVGDSYKNDFLSPYKLDMYAIHIQRKKGMTLDAVIQLLQYI